MAQDLEKVYVLIELDQVVLEDSLWSSEGWILKFLPLRVSLGRIRGEISDLDFDHFD